MDSSVPAVAGAISRQRSAGSRYCSVAVDDLSTPGQCQTQATPSRPPASRGRLRVRNGSALGALIESAFYRSILAVKSATDEGEGSCLSHPILGDWYLSRACSIEGDELAPGRRSRRLTVQRHGRLHRPDNSPRGRISRPAVLKRDDHTG